MARKEVLGARKSMLELATGYANGKMTPTVMTNLDGQNGITTDFRTLNASALYPKQDVICILLEAPRGFQFFPQPVAKMLVGTLKALVETAAEKIDGLDSSIKAEYFNTTLGRNEQLDQFSRSTRERSEPSFTWAERYGAAISKFFETWIVMLMGDPQTRVPGVVTSAYHWQGGGNGVSSDFHTPAASWLHAHGAYTLMPENISATMLFIEPDPTMSYPVRSWLCTNMMPDNAGDAVGSRDMTSGSDKVEITVKFTAVQEVNQGVQNLAAEILSKISKKGLASHERRCYLGTTYAEASDATGQNIGSRHMASTTASTLSHNPNADVNAQYLGFIAQSRSISQDENAVKMNTFVSPEAANANGS